MSQPYDWISHIVRYAMDFGFHLEWHRPLHQTHQKNVGFSPGPLIYKLRQALKDFTSKDHLLLTGDPAIIGVACSIVSDLTSGNYKLLKWDRQERKYYPIEINLYERGKIDE